MRINQSVKDELATHLRELGFTSCENNRKFEFQHVTIAFTPVRVAITDTRMYVIGLRNEMIRGVWSGKELAARGDSILDAINTELQKNKALIERRDALCEVVKAGCASLRLYVDYVHRAGDPRVSVFSLDGWTHSVFHLRYNMFEDKFYVRIPGGIPNEYTDDGDYPWVTDVDDIVAHAQRMFRPRKAVHSAMEIRTLEHPVEWLYWMFMYGFDSLSTYRHETRRESDDQIVNALLPEDIEVVTLYVLTFRDPIPQTLPPRVEKEPKTYPEDDEQPKRKHAEE